MAKYITSTILRKLSEMHVLQAMTGCDTISRIEGVGKINVFHKLVTADNIVRCSANAFAVPHQPHR